MSEIIKDIWEWFKKLFKKMPLCLKITILIAIFALARLNFLGENLYKLTKRIIPVQLLENEKPPVIPLSFTYEIETANGKRNGKLNDICYSGDRINLNFKTGSPCWLTVFGVDTKDIHPVFNRQFSPGKIEKDKLYFETFNLDTTIGTEIYYAIASHDEFEFNQEIKPALLKLFPEGNSKGPIFSDYFLDLPNKFMQRHIYFLHLKKK